MEYERKDLYFGLACIACMAFMGLYVFLIYPKHNRKRRLLERATREGNVVIATVKDVRIVWGSHETGNDVNDNTQEHVKYTYTIDGKTYIKRLIFHSNSLYDGRVPQQVKLYYDPKNPRKAYSESELTQKPGTIGCFVCVLVPIIFFYIIFTISKR